MNEKRLNKILKDKKELEKQIKFLNKAEEILENEV